MYGTALVVQWGCTSGHSCGSWASQPKMKRMFCGNLQLSTSILFSGNSYMKIALLAKFLNLGIIGEPTFYQVQRLYAAPAINKYWTVMQTQLLSEKVRQRQDVRVAGDGRNDSPGHSAQFCTYSFSDLDTDAILHLEVVDVRQSTSSVAMEKVAFQHGLNFLTSKVKVTEVVTDQSPMITKVMRITPGYQAIDDQYDIWHVAKNLEKRLIASCKPSSVLRQWITPIKNHFWWSAQVCEGQTIKMKEIWLRVLSHVCNIHEWHVAGHTEGKCSHAPINETEDREQPWLDKNSPEMDSLRHVVTEPRFLKQFHYFRKFRHTGALESFNSHILTYSPKRHSYQFTGYLARNQLAAIDHNHHLHRPEQTNSEGETMYMGIYSKRTQRWRPRTAKVLKNYSYRWDLQMMAFQQRDQEETGGLKRKQPMADDGASRQQLQRDPVP
ncbi:uncharacterized protein LOC124126050 [Haliotis rufescens]|uniref:uncharacterized protein LOC124126050 n=1 Tax=Haliotis rufescens TaxID=6454 RepID=UPI00201ED345|nr:uncharacterized protein LOC124126050 [Haliotis rufescens]XP_046345433.2 uncharacterized protein LOC124126050 [Haliotis rufescens]